MDVHKAIVQIPSEGGFNSYVYKTLFYELQLVECLDVHIESNSSELLVDETLVINTHLLLNFFFLIHIFILFGFNILKCIYKDCIYYAESFFETSHHKRFCP